MKRHSLLTFIAVSLAATACHQQAAEISIIDDMQSKILYHSIQCGRSDNMPTVTKITNKNDLQVLFDRLSGPIFGTKSTAPPNVDFEKESVVLIEMGQQPTTGYNITLGALTPAFEKGALILHLDWISPQPDAVNAQVITSPCLLISVPHKDYASILVNDQHDSLRIQTPTTGNWE